MREVTCLLPWVELHLTAQGQAKTCCAQTDNYKSSSDASWKAIFNGEDASRVRSEFLQGGTPLGCTACLKAESSGPSYRTFQSPLWEHHRDVARRNRMSDSELPIRYLDLRFSNFCNFACRTCDSSSSHKWIEFDRYLGRPVHDHKGWDRDPALLAKVKAALSTVEEIYFAGGEPLLSEGHCLVLDELLKQGRTDIRLRYNSNLSTLHYRGRDLLELWSRFNDVKVFPSFDSIGERAEYIRVGSKWAVIEENVRRALPYLGAINCVLSAYNVFSILDLVKWANTLSRPVTIFPAYNPPEIAISILPVEVRKQAVEAYSRFLETEPMSHEQRGRIETAIVSLSQVSESQESDPVRTREFIRLNRYLDQAHGTDFVSTFPEHRNWYHGKV